MIHRTSIFHPSDRYRFDMMLKGFAQVDTTEDAPYYGIWVSPKKRMIVNYSEGDVSFTYADNGQDFKEEILNLIGWLGERFKGIDPGWPGLFSTEQIVDRFKIYGLERFLH